MKLYNFRFRDLVPGLVLAFLLLGFPWLGEKYKATQIELIISDIAVLFMGVLFRFHVTRPVIFWTGTIPALIILAISTLGLDLGRTYWIVVLSLYIGSNVLIVISAWPKEAADSSSG